MIGDSYEMVRYLDRTYPSPSLDQPGNSEAEAVTGQIFNVFATWAKNKEPAKEMELCSNFTAELEKIERFLAQGKGRDLALLACYVHC